MGKPKMLNKMPAVMVPQTREEVSVSILRIGELQRQRTRIEAAMNDEVATAKARYEAEAEPHKREIIALSEGVKIWCAANRDELTGKGRVKHFKFSGGEVRWRMTPPKVVVRGVEAVIDMLKRTGLTQFIRVKEEVNKEAILADGEAWTRINGVVVQQAEEFVIVPFETTLEEVV